MRLVDVKALRGTGPVYYATATDTREGVWDGHAFVLSVPAHTIPASAFAGRAMDLDASTPVDKAMAGAAAHEGAPYDVHTVAQWLDMLEQAQSEGICHMCALSVAGQRILINAAKVATWVRAAGGLLREPVRGSVAETAGVATLLLRSLEWPTWELLVAGVSLCSEEETK